LVKSLSGISKSSLIDQVSTDSTSNQLTNNLEWSKKK
jgi:hypothetical protein